MNGFLEEHHISKALKDRVDSCMEYLFSSNQVHGHGYELLEVRFVSFCSSLFPFQISHAVCAQILPTYLRQEVGFCIILCLLVRPCDICYASVVSVSYRS